MSLSSRGIKISDQAFSAVRKEISTRFASPTDRVKIKDVASDLILRGFEQKADLNDFENLSVQYILSLKEWEDRETVELLAHCLFWDHIKLSLSRGYKGSHAYQHVAGSIMNNENKAIVVSVIEGLLFSQSL